MTQQELADCLEISQSKLSKIENGKIQKIDLTMILKLCQCFEIEVNNFVLAVTEN